MLYDGLDISYSRILTQLIHCPQPDLDQLAMPWKLGLQVVSICVAYLTQLVMVGRLFAVEVNGQECQSAHRTW